MAIGYRVSVGGINSQAGGLASRWQQVAADLLTFSTIAGALSHADLVTLGFSSADATAMVTLITQMGDFANVYYGNQAQSPAFNYDTAFLPVRGTA